jgi:hypothetical protein
MSGFDYKFLVYFTTIQHDASILSKEMKKQFQKAEIVGCSSVGTMISGVMFEKGLVVMAFHKDVIEDLKIEVVSNIREEQERNVISAFKSFEKHFGKNSREWSYTEYVGLIFSNAMLNAEEKIMETIGGLTNVFFVGGSAADDLKFEKNIVYANENYYENSSVLVMMKPKIGFEVIKTQNFEPTDKKVVVTKANPKIREVMELDNKPVLERYAELVEISLEELPEHLFMNPLGIIAEEDVYIRSPLMPSGNNTLFFACSVLEGMELNLLKNKDMIEQTKKIIDELTSKEKISGILSFNCAYRLLELNAKNQAQEYAKLFEKVPTVGLNGFGEAFLGHINQTLTMLVFK